MKPMRRLALVLLFCLSSVVLAGPFAVPEGRIDQIVHDNRGYIIKAIGVDANGQYLEMQFWYRDIAVVCTPGLFCMPPPWDGVLYAQREITGDARVVGPWLRVSDGQPDPSIPTGPL